MKDQECTQYLAVYDVDLNLIVFVLNNFIQKSCLRTTVIHYLSSRL